jgi:hypothetical protein
MHVRMGDEAANHGVRHVAVAEQIAGRDAVGAAATAWVPSVFSPVWVAVASRSMR